MYLPKKIPTCGTDKDIAKNAEQSQQLNEGELKLKTAHAVIGSNYGDEGKAHMTDYFCWKENADMVIRFNGGANAGGTVVTPEGHRHVFKHYGAGGFLGVPTFLSRFFIVNPLLFVEEGFPGKVFVDPDCLVTTPMDMFLNQALERGRRHGSCGIGINETVTRSQFKLFKLTVKNMLDEQVYDAIVENYLPLRMMFLELTGHGYEDKWKQVYFDCARKFLNNVIITDAPPGETIVFEGAQGLGLDQASPDYPHVTRSNTGIKNVLTLCAEWGLENITATYVTRSYLTRHGMGPLPGEQLMPQWVKDSTNLDNEWQGALRYAPLDPVALEKRIKADSGNIHCNVAITCVDQHNMPLGTQLSLPVRYASYGPCRTDVIEIIS